MYKLGTYVDLFEDGIEGYKLDDVKSISKARLENGTLAIKLTTKDNEEFVFVGGL